MTLRPMAKVAGRAAVRQVPVRVDVHVAPAQVLHGLHAAVGGHLVLVVVHVVRDVFHERLVLIRKLPRYRVSGDLTAAS